MHFPVPNNVKSIYRPGAIWNQLYLPDVIPGKPQAMYNDLKSFICQYTRKIQPISENSDYLFGSADFLLFQEYLGFSLITTYVEAENKKINFYLFCEIWIGIVILLN